MGAPSFEEETAVIVTLTLNPCIDRTTCPDGSYTEQTGGKGINVARVLSALGEPCEAVAPIGGGENGKRLVRLARDEGVLLTGVPVTSDTRRIDTRYDPETNEQSVDYARGSDASPSEIEALSRTLEKALTGARLLMLCGSAPGANAASFAAEAIRMAKRKGVDTLLDSNGEALARAFEAGPTFLKVNRSECMQLYGRDIPEGGEAEAAESLLSTETRGVIVTLGDKGAVWARQGGTLFCPAPKGKTVNAVGSGDCFAAALVWALLNGLSDYGALTIACAAGAANARVFPAARINKTDIEAALGHAIPINRNQANI